jgi:hypothetical protein
MTRAEQRAAPNTGSTTEWGIRDKRGTVMLCGSEATADELLALYGLDVVEVVRREVTPWGRRDPGWLTAPLDRTPLPTSCRPPDGRHP